MTISREVSDVPSSSPAVRPPGFPWWQATVAGALTASLINLSVLLVAGLAGASLVLRQVNAADHRINAIGVIVASVAPMTVGILLASLLAARWPGVLRLAQVVGGALGLVSAVGPLFSNSDGGTRGALVIMHVVVAVTVVVALEMIRRRRAAQHR